MQLVCQCSCFYFWHLFPGFPSHWSSSPADLFSSSASSTSRFMCQSFQCKAVKPQQSHQAKGCEESTEVEQWTPNQHRAAKEPAIVMQKYFFSSLSNRRINLGNLLRFLPLGWSSDQLEHGLPTLPRRARIFRAFWQKAPLGLLDAWSTTIQSCWHWEGKRSSPAAKNPVVCRKTEVPFSRQQESLAKLTTAKLHTPNPRDYIRQLTAAATDAQTLNILVSLLRILSQISLEGER